MRFQALSPALLAALVFATGFASAPAVARDQIRVVGSSTVYPFITTTAERFGKGKSFKTPVVESTGTGGGFKLFCSGVGPSFPDIANASRPIKASERAACAANGVTAIVEIKIGYDGIVLANAQQSAKLALTRAQLYRALAKNVPLNGAFVPNPYKRWSEIDPSLPNEKIEVMGPPPTSGTRDAFVEHVLEPSCAATPEGKALQSGSDAFRASCLSVREDGAYVEAGENDNLIVQKLKANPASHGIFGFSYLEQNTDQIQGAAIDGVVPTFETIASGQYPLSRPLFIYVKKAHVEQVPGIAAFLAELTSENAWGPSGYLVDKGLIPLADSERPAWAAKAAALTEMEK